VARLIDVSQYYFCRSFRTSMGVSPYKYVIQQRIAKAKNLIASSKLPLAEIAYDCGFSSQSQMTQHFRKCVGVTPKVYRNQL
ncbi:MAG: AraC family transcriptional regulator, partial [Cyanobacteria bacterium J06631_2]